MVNCAVYHEFELKQNTYAIIEPNGSPYLLEGIFGSVGAVPMDKGPLLALLRGKIVADLRPGIDGCFALGPYYLKEEGMINPWNRAQHGELVHRAKYNGDERPMPMLCDEVATFVRAHPDLSAVKLIVATPVRVAGDRRPIARLSTMVARALEAELVHAKANRATQEQKNLATGLTLQDLKQNISGSMGFGEEVSGQAVLIVDDVLGSGETLREMGRALREAGARLVFGLCVAKDARFTGSWLKWDKNLWPDNE